MGQGKLTSSHSSGYGYKPTWRGDVGIAPYIPSELHSIQPGVSKPSGCGRLVAAPTGACHSSGRGWKPTWRGDVGIVPYIPAGVHSIQRGWSKPSGFGRLVAAPTGGTGGACHSTGRAERVPLGRAMGYSPASWQNRSIFSETSCRAARQKALSVRSMPATRAVSSAVATVVVRSSCL